MICRSDTVLLAVPTEDLNFIIDGDPVKKHIKKYIDDYQCKSFVKILQHDGFTLIVAKEDFELRFHGEDNSAVSVPPT